MTNINEKTVKLYIGGIDPEWSSEKVLKLLSKHGKVIRADVVKNYAFVFVEDNVSADSIIKNVSGTTVDGSKIVIQISKNKQNLVNGDDVCFECGKGGHWAKDCSQRRARLESKNGMPMQRGPYGQGAVRKPERFMERPRQYEREPYTRNPYTRDGYFSDPYARRPYTRELVQHEPYIQEPPQNVYHREVYTHEPYEHNMVYQREAYREPYARNMTYTREIYSPGYEYESRYAAPIARPRSPLSRPVYATRDPAHYSYSGGPYDTAPASYRAPVEYQRHVAPAMANPPARRYAEQEHLHPVDY